MPTRRTGALPSGESSLSADGGRATEEGAGGPGTGYQVPGATTDTPAPSADSWFIPRGQQQPQRPGQGPAPTAPGGPGRGNQQTNDYPSPGGYAPPTRYGPQPGVA
jgi:hypothetical protein